MRSVTFNEIIDEILLVETPRKRLSTQEIHKIYLDELSSEIGARTLDGFGRKEYSEWMLAFKKSKDRTTFNDYTKFINIIFNYAYQHKHISHRVKFPMMDPERETCGRVYNKSELGRLWLALYPVEFRTQFVLAIECYMRLREVLHLTWDRVDLDRKTITLRKQDVKTGSKCGKGRVVPLSENAVTYLLKLQRIADTRWVFPNPSKTGFVNSNRKMWAKVKRKAKITGRARWHDLRHTALSIAVLEKKVSLAHLSLVAGVSIRTLERVYLHGDIEHLRDIAKSINILEEIS